VFCAIYRADFYSVSSRSFEGYGFRTELEAVNGPRRPTLRYRDAEIEGLADIKLRSFPRRHGYQDTGGSVSQDRNRG